MTRLPRLTRRSARPNYLRPYGISLRSIRCPGLLTTNISSPAAFAAFDFRVLRWLMLRGAGGRAGAVARRDLGVGLALAASWFAIWSLYSAYTWTADPTSVTVQVVRFYVPALGAIALLGAWLVTRIPGHAWPAGLTSAAVIATLFGLGVWSFYAMYAAFGVPLGGVRH